MVNELLSILAIALLLFWIVALPAYGAYLFFTRNDRRG